MQIKHLAIAVLLAIFSLVIFWAPFKLNLPSILGVEFEGVGMERIVQNFDGLNFLIVAKTSYDPKLIEQDYQEVLSGRRPLYFSAHYPGLPLLIRFFDNFMTGPNALILVILVSNILLSISLYWFFYFTTKDNSKSFILTLVALFFPARMLSVRAVGSNEMLFMFFVYSSLLFHERKRLIAAATMGSLAVLTRSPGIILLFGYGIHFLLHRDNLYNKIKFFLPYSLIPLSLLGLWTYYGAAFGSFWSYFQVGGNINLYYPFAVFSSNMPWVGEIWLEDIIYLFAFMITGIYFYVRKNGYSAISLFSILYATFILCVAHRDLARYSLPIMPIVIAGWSNLVPYKLFKVLGLILIIPIYLYAWQFVLANYQIVTDWTKFL